MSNIRSKPHVMMKRDVNSYLDSSRPLPKIEFGEESVGIEATFRCRTTPESRWIFTMVVWIYDKVFST